MTRPERGLTVIELILAMTLLGGLVLALGSMAMRGAALEGETRTSLAEQQELATLLRRFSEDVRSALAVVGSPGPSRVTLQQPGQRYVTYRLDAGKLRRGLGASATQEPATWEDLVDSQRFEVSSGRFRFYAAEGVETSASAAMRRVDLVDLRLRSRHEAQERTLPELSAALRGQARSGTIEVVGPGGGDEIVMANSAAKKTEFALRNRSNQPITIRYFHFAWQLPLTSDPLKQFWIGSVKWMDHQKDVPGELPASVTIGSLSQVGVELHFDDTMPEPLLGTLSLYTPDDVLRERPYVVQLRIVRR